MKMSVMLVAVAMIMATESHALSPEPLSAPLLAKVRAYPPASLFVDRRDGGRIVANLARLIATPDSDLAPLRDRKVFAQAKVAKDGHAVIWPSHAIEINSRTLHRIAAEQFRASNRSR